MSDVETKSKRETEAESSAAARFPARRRVPQRERGFVPQRLGRSECTVFRHKGRRQQISALTLRSRHVRAECGRRALLALNLRLIAAQHWLDCGSSLHERLGVDICREARGLGHHVHCVPLSFACGPQRGAVPRCCARPVRLDGQPTIMLARPVQIRTASLRAYLMTEPQHLILRLSRRRYLKTCGRTRGARMTDWR